MVIYEKDEKLVFHVCLNCGQNGHFEFKCPQIIYSDIDFHDELYI